MTKGTDKGQETSATPSELEGFSDFDKLLEHRVRLSICVLLSREQVFTFVQFKKTLGETDGNLGAHLKRLEDAGYVKVSKRFENRKPVSRYAITKTGREALEKHLEGLANLLKQVQST